MLSFVKIIPIYGAIVQNGTEAFEFETYTYDSPTSRNKCKDACKDICNWQTSEDNDKDEGSNKSYGWCSLCQPHQ